jgi:hypothetical protein
MCITITILLLNTYPHGRIGYLKRVDSFCFQNETSPVHFKCLINDTKYNFSQYVISAAQAMCSIAADPSLKRKEAWQALQATAGLLQKPPTESNALAIAFVFGALSLMKDDAAKASARAMMSTVSRKKPLRHAGWEIANRALRAFLVHL